MFKQLKNLIGGAFDSARKTSGEEIVLRKNKFGVVSADTEVIRRVVERDAVNVKGVHDLKASVDLIGSSRLKISLQIVLNQNNSAPNVSAALEKNIREDLKSIFEVTDVSLDMKITEFVRNETSERRRKLR